MEDVRTTAADAMREVVRHGGENAAALFASMIEQQGRDLAAALPTWETVERVRHESYVFGYSQGLAQAYAEVHARIFGQEEVSA